jgi:putative cardiolipin synthase
MNRLFPFSLWRVAAIGTLMSLFILCSCGKDHWVPRSVKSKVGPLNVLEIPHRVALLEDGRTALWYRLFLLRSARHSIRIQTFILTDDPVGLLVMEELVRASQRGVSVQLLSDAMFTDIKLERLAMLAHLDNKLEIRIYNPPTDKIAPDFLSLSGAMASWRRFHQRMHSKLLVVDDQVAICGGRNIADEYYDADPKLNFLDLDIVVKGPLVQDISASFQEYWESPLVIPIQWMSDVAAATSEEWNSPLSPHISKDDPIFFDAELARGEPRLTWHQVQRIAFWTDPPHKPAPSEDPTAIAARLASLLGRTQNDLLLQSPYLVLSDQAIEIFKWLRKQQVRVRVSTNSLAATDNWLSYAHSLRQRRMMLEDLKFKIYEIKAFPGDLLIYMPKYDQLRAAVRKVPENQPPGPPDPKLCLHSKTLIIDNWISLVGTYNLDPRSARLNTENGVAIWDASFARYLRSKIERDMHPANSWVVAKQPLPLPLEPIQMLIEEVNELAMTITSFDLWPLRYSALFELREGMEPVPPDHPDFHKHYRTVGLFPGVDFLDLKRILVELTRMLTGVFRPLI